VESIGAAYLAVVDDNCSVPIGLHVEIPHAAQTSATMFQAGEQREVRRAIPRARPATPSLPRGATAPSRLPTPREMKSQHTSPHTAPGTKSLSVCAPREIMGTSIEV
jgi:hypothetical protein